MTVTAFLLPNGTIKHASTEYAGIDAMRELARHLIAEGVQEDEVLAFRRPTKVSPDIYGPLKVWASTMIEESASQPIRMTKWRPNPYKEYDPRFLSWFEAYTKKTQESTNGKQ